MISVPSFDPNLFVNGISQTDYTALLNNPDKPLLDRALQGSYVPGSTVKPFIASAGLELGFSHTFGYDSFDRRVSHSRTEARLSGCSSWWTWPRRSGPVARAIGQHLFLFAGPRHGHRRFSESMAKFGFGKPTGIDLVGESDGVLPSREWKRAHSNEPWYPAETVIAGIGQGYWVVTPLQLAHGVAMLAAAGFPSPHLLRATQKESMTTPIPSRSSRRVPSYLQGSFELGAGPRGHDCRGQWTAGTARRIGDRISVRDRRQDRHRRALFAHGRGLAAYFTVRSIATRCCSRRLRRPKRRASLSWSALEAGHGGGTTRLRSFAK